MSSVIFLQIKIATNALETGIFKSLNEEDGNGDVGLFQTDILFILFSIRSMKCV